MISPDVEHLVQLIFVLRNRVLANIDLQPLARLHQVQKPGLAHPPHGLDAPGDFHLRLLRQLLRGLRRILAQNVGNRVREIEPLAVGAESERFDLRRALQALVEQIVFKGHKGLITAHDHFTQMVARQEKFHRLKFLEQFFQTPVVEKLRRPPPPASPPA